MAFANLPATQSYLTNFVNLFRLPLENGQSVTLLGLPATGKSGFIQYFLREGDKISPEAALFRKHFTFICLDLLTHTSIEEITTQIKKQVNATDWKEKLYQTTFQKGERYVFIIDNPDSLFDLPFVTRKLISTIQAINPMAIHFLFSITKEITVSQVKRYLPEIALPLLQNIVYCPLPAQADLLIGIANQQEWHGSSLSTTEKTTLATICGGWGGLMRILLRRLTLSDDKVRGWLKQPQSEETTKSLFSDQEIKTYFDRLYDSFSAETKSFLLSQAIAGRKLINPIPAYLTKTGCLTQDVSGKPVFFCPWFETYLKNETQKQSQTLCETNGVLFLDDQNLDKLLTPQELTVFRLLWSRRNRLVTRDDIAKTIWGTDWPSHYSDWAIDKLLARIRKKIGDTGTKRLIKAIKGRGLTLRVEKD